MYTPINPNVFTAAYTGILSGYYQGRLPTSPDPTEYAGVAAIAGTWAQAFDITWGAHVLNELSLVEIADLSEGAWAGRGFVLPPTPESLLTSTYTSQILALIAIIDESEAYYISQGIPLPAVPSAVYATQTAWFINATTGNDGAAGGTAGTAIKTHAELENRLRGLTLNPAAPSLITITVLTNLPITDPTNLTQVSLGPNALGLVYQGTATPVFAGTATATVARNESLNQPFEFADALFPDPWSNHFIAQRIRLTSGGFTGFVAWPAFDLGAGNARVSAWASPIFLTTYLQDINTTTVGPAPADTYVLEGLSQITLGSLDVRYLTQDAVLSIMFVDFQVLAPTQGAFGNFNSTTPQQRLFIQCCMGGDAANRDFEWDNAAQEVSMANCCNLTRQRYRYGTSYIAGGLTHNDGLGLLGRWQFAHHCTPTFDADVLCQGDVGSTQPFQFSFGCTANIASVGFFGYAGQELIRTLSRSFLQFRSAHLYDAFGIGTATVWGDCVSGTVLAMDGGIWAGGNFLFESWFITGGILDFTMGYDDFVDNHDGRALNWGTFFGASAGAVAGDGTYSIPEVVMSQANMFLGIGVGGFLNGQRPFGPFTVDEGKMTNLQGECAFVYRDLHF